MFMVWVVLACDSVRTVFLCVGRGGSCMFVCGLGMCEDRGGALCDLITVNISSHVCHLSLTDSFLALLILM